MVRQTDNESKVRRELFSRYKPDIYKLIKHAESKKGNSRVSNGKIHEREPTWKSGARSYTQSYTVEGYRPDSSSLEFNRYLVKIVPMDFARDIFNELAVLDSTNSRISNIFAPLVGYKSKGDHIIIVLELLKYLTLYEKYKGDIVIPLNDLLQATEPCISLNRFTKDDEEVHMLEQKIHSLSEKYWGKERAIRGLDQFTTEDYVSFFMKCLSANKGIPEKVKSAIKDSIGELAKAYLTRPDMVRLIQHDCYPWNHLGNKLIDAGDMKLGSPGMQLGRLLGHPSIYNKLFYPSGQTNTNKQENAEACIQEITDYYAAKLGLDKRVVNSATYVGGMYGVVRLLPGQDFTECEKDEFKLAALDQLESLGKRDDTAKYLKKALALAWGIQNGR